MFAGINYCNSVRNVYDFNESRTEYKTNFNYSINNPKKIKYG